ncbi:MAG TPA: NAD-dependent epimerase/dehydratase family protein [Candidatus Binataceae bacterium]|nr:NAD-dependent epimerase/dehydratase family protein [Candidatus Binataceae bacterium]
MKILVTGSSGLIGSEAVRYYDALGHQVIGIDNNMRAFFFGPSGDTTWNLRQLQQSTQNFTHCDIDIRNREQLFALFEANPFDLVIHCAAQPSHDRAREIALLDFEVNALGTVNMLEAARRWCPASVFILMSTNKVYGDSPNELQLVELEKRYEYARPEDYDGIDENCRIDQCLHSLFGASKLAADIVAQEYGRYFGMKVGVFRGGCLTGPAHSAVELHGFLSYLIKVAMSGGTYRVYGYQGKQVRDNIHSGDVIQAFEAFRREPHPGEVYNLGGGRENSVSILEVFDLIEEITGRRVNWTYVDENRIGDHMCYITNLSKFKSHYPQWTIRRSTEDILRELVAPYESQGDEKTFAAVADGNR